MADTKISAASRLTGVGIVKVPAALAGSTTAFALAHNLEATTAPGVGDDSADGYSVGSLWFNSAAGDLYICRVATVGAAVWRKLAPGHHIGYLASNWYIPPGCGFHSATGANGLNTIRLTPFAVEEEITISDLGARLNAAQASSNIQLAIYGNNPAINEATGNALASTASIPTTTGAQWVSAALGANVAIKPGLAYWLASNSDNASTTFALVGVLISPLTSLMGRPALSELGGNTFGQNSLSIAQTFGTWPDLTAAAFTVGNGNNPLIPFKVASQP